MMQQNSNSRESLTAPAIIKFIKGGPKTMKPGIERDNPYTDLAITGRITAPSMECCKTCFLSSREFVGVLQKGIRKHAKQK